MNGSGRRQASGKGPVRPRPGPLRAAESPASLNVLACQTEPLYSLPPADGGQTRTRAGFLLGLRGSDPASAAQEERGEAGGKSGDAHYQRDDGERVAASLVVTLVRGRRGGLGSTAAGLGLGGR